jgi:periplasmic divalent cation tolerance protein
VGSVPTPQVISPARGRQRIVLSTLPAEHDAEALAETLVVERLVACVNVLPPMRSIYRWQGQVERADERQLVMKTTAAQVPALQSRLRQLHPYDLPELLVVPVAGGGDAYLAWVHESTSPA